MKEGWMSTSNSADVKKNNTIIDDHRNMLMVSKKISVWQENQLRGWCFIVFDNISSIKIKYDFDDGEEFNPGKVEFIFDFKVIPEGLVKDKGLEHLTLWTQSIFWSNTEVKFRIGKKIWK